MKGNGECSGEAEALACQLQPHCPHTYSSISFSPSYTYSPTYKLDHIWKKKYHGNGLFSFLIIYIKAEDSSFHLFILFFASSLRDDKS